MWGDTSLWFWFAFPWWLVMLNTFSCTSWLYLCLIWKKCLSSLLPIFWVIGRGFFLLLSYIYVCLFWTLILYLIDDFPNIFPTPYVAFLSCWWFPLLCRSFLVWCISTCLYLLPLLLVPSAKYHCQDQCQGVYSIYILLEL